jgi:hypothetical protein
MKINNLLTLLLVIISINTQAQSYAFEVSTGTYTDLTDTISLNEGISWDDPEFNIPIGFNFEFYTQEYNLITLGLGLGGTLVFGDPYMDPDVSVILPYGADIVDRAYDVNNDQPTESLSPISYRLDGDLGSQILKIEWRNVGFYSELFDDGISTDFTNFQLWFYEGSNTIEVHFGPNNVANPSLSYDDETGTSVGIFDRVVGDDYYAEPIATEGLALEGDPSSPDAISTTVLFESFLNGNVPNGTIYRFTRIMTNAEETENASVGLQIFPNPTDDFIKFTLDDSALDVQSISIIDVSGQLVRNLDPNTRSENIADLSSGVYFIDIKSANGKITKKFVKK